MESLSHVKTRRGLVPVAPAPTAPSTAPTPAPPAASNNGRGAAVPAAVSPAPTPPPAPKASAALGLAGVIATYRKWLDLPDSGALEMMLAAYAANRLPGDPCWLLLVGPPSGGKGEIINSFETLPFTHRAAQLSEASLLSGTARDSRATDATGGLLFQVGRFGIVVLKDLTSVFTQNKDERGKALSALRHCYDGSWFRPVGSEGGKVLKWEGRLGLVGGTTEAIDTEHRVMASLGPRFLFYRLPAADAIKQAQCALDTRAKEVKMRAELSTAVQRFLGRLNFKGSFPIPEPDRAWLVALVTLAVCCRSHVERSAYNHEIEQIPASEGPGRMMRAIGQLWAGLALIGVDPERRRALLRKTAFDSMPPIRRIAFDHLRANKGKPATAADIARTCRYPEQTVRRALQDLRCHGVVVSRRFGKAEVWSIDTAWQEQCALLFKAEPAIIPPKECSDGGAE